MEKLVDEGGLTSRDEVLRLAYPGLSEGPEEEAAQRHSRRMRAEAALSRAIRSLELKGLVSRERNPMTGRTLIRSADQDRLPPWEQLARGEEDLAAHCRSVGERWLELSARARGRAQRIREERSPETTAEEREADLDEVARLGRGG